MMRRSYVLLGLMVLIILGVLPSGEVGAQRRAVVALQAGHWRTEEHADEFWWLRTSTGAVHGGVREVDLNVDVAHRAAEYLRAWGHDAYVLPANVPPAYRADAFVAIHADGNSNREARGFKVATYYRNWVATDWLVRELEDEYGKQTGLPKDWRITANMRGYYAFNSGLYEHTIAEDTPGAIIEMGFLSNDTDRAYLIEHRDHVAWSIALGIARFLGTKPQGGWPEPPLLPRGDIVQVLHDNVPLFAEPNEYSARVGQAFEQQRYAVAERRQGWARLFSYDGNIRWIQDWQTMQIYVP